MTRPSLPRGHRALALLVLVVSCSAALSAQAPMAGDTLGEVASRRNAGDFVAAERLLRAYLVGHPDNGDAARILAQTIYWQHRNEEAQAAYERALQRHPADTALRLEYGRMLIETRDGARARAVLAPIAQAPAIRGRADALLGTLAYWEGAFGEAERHLRHALDADPVQPEIRRMLGDVWALTAPHVRTSGEMFGDDQPLRRFTAELEAGRYATPDVALTALGRVMQFSGTGGATPQIRQVEFGLAMRESARPLAFGLGAGLVHRPGAEPTAWTVHAQVAVHPAPGVTLRGRGERRPYLSTVASLDTPVMTQAYAATLALATQQSWLGEASVRDERFPDGNQVWTAYGWLLAPLARGARGTLQVGYGASAQSSTESRFALANTRQSYAPSDPRFSLVGVYRPYYTPLNLATQSVLAALTVRPSAGTVLRINGAYGLVAAQDRPTFTVVAGALRSTTVRDPFTPWNVHGGSSVALSDGWQLESDVEYGYTAFYRATTARLWLSHAFSAAARTRAARY